MSHFLLPEEGILQVCQYSYIHAYVLTDTLITHVKSEMSWAMYVRETTTSYFLGDLSKFLA